MGNALEFYDFTVYTVFAVDIGRTFFPGHSDFERTLLSLATFGIGFIPRPIGAVVIGALGDRIGRRPAMLLTFALMGLAIVGLACTPGYAQIGVAAPILVLLFRLIQGFALGGEVGPVMAFLIEASNPKRRGFIGSWQSASQSVASLIGGMVGLIVTQTMAPHLVSAYGWRIAFWVGALVLPFGLMIRRALPETLHHPEAPSEAHPALADRMPGWWALLVAHRRVLLLGAGVIVCFTTSTYVRLFVTTYAITTLHIAGGAAYGASVVNGVTGVIFTLLGGALSDRWGRRPAMILPLAAYLLATYPTFWLIVRNHDPMTLWVGTGVISALSSMSTGATLIWLTEALRKEIRSMATGGVYAITVALFGGITQPLLVWLIKVTNQPLAPAFYLMITTVIGLAAMLGMRETAPVRLRAAGASAGS